MDSAVHSDRPRMRPVPFTRVRIDDAFWAPRVRTNREQTIPFEYLQCKKTGRIDAFKLDWKPGKEPKPHIFWDSDVAKWIEAASYSLATHPDPKLDAQLDEVVNTIVAAQQPDGYLNVYFTVVEPEKRWSDLRDCHELYCAGHLIEAGVAHYEATGKRKLLDAVCRYADHIDTVFGRRAGQKRGYCGHPEIELALVKLYRTTGERKYLELARYFVDERGQKPNYFDEERRARGGAPAFFDAYFERPGRTFNLEYCQAHRPVREQERVVGHAVRAMYLYSAMADLAGELEDRELRAACERLWRHLTGRLMYVTGGVGSSSDNEGFTSDYDLPNETAYCETCASIGLVFWSHRLLHLDCDGRYADVMERALYNGVVSGVSLDGERFFYVNPLASSGRHHRQEWFDCACCPPNLARLLASVSQYVYSESDADAIVHLYVQSEATLRVRGQDVRLRQRTGYPWDGRVRITVEPTEPASFGVKLRVPGWCREASVEVNGEAWPTLVDNGYVRIERPWKPGDHVELRLALPIERVYAHPRVRANLGRVALQRGPIVYCLEEVDNGAPLDAIALPSAATLEARFEPDLLGGVVTLHGQGIRRIQSDWSDDLYRHRPAADETVPVRAIPYAVWDNRDPGEMLVWIREV